MNIKEMRYATGMTQKEFAERFHIPIGTLRRWEYGESTPASYIVELIARELPVDRKMMKTIEDGKGNTFYYNKEAGYLVDRRGTRIFVQVDLDGVKKQNLILYIEDLFESYYEILNKFHQDCRLDETEDIIWS